MRGYLVYAINIKFLSSFQGYFLLPLLGFLSSPPSPPLFLPLLSSFSSPPSHICSSLLLCSPLISCLSSLSFPPSSPLIILLSSLSSPPPPPPPPPPSPHLFHLGIAGLGIAINSMCVNEAFCATASDDGFLRLWPLDFKQVYLEAGELDNGCFFLIPSSPIDSFFD
jgi:hypothetical protein